jgi:4-carboxymuconolactone decarboxylase
MPERYDEGMKIRRKVLGDAHVDAAEARRSDFDAAFQTLITEGAWGSVWARQTISLRERSMLTIALLAAGGNFDEIPMHIRATANTGASPGDVLEALLHVAVYAGVPKANRAIAIARETYAEMGVQT